VCGLHLQNCVGCAARSTDNFIFFHFSCSFPFFVFRQNCWSSRSARFRAAASDHVSHTTIGCRGGIQSVSRVSASRSNGSLDHRSSREIVCRWGWVRAFLQIRGQSLQKHANKCLRSHHIRVRLSRINSRNTERAHPVMGRQFHDGAKQLVVLRLQFRGRDPLQSRGLQQPRADASQLLAVDPLQPRQSRVHSARVEAATLDIAVRGICDHQ
jgi:hypothetical protein